MPTSQTALNPRLQVPLAVQEAIDEKRTRVTRVRIEAGQSFPCSNANHSKLLAENTVSFSTKDRTRCVIVVNVISEEGVWLRIEYYHEACYKALGEPYGPVIATIGHNRRAATR